MKAHGGWLQEKAENIKRYFEVVWFRLWFYCSVLLIFFFLLHD